MTDLTEYDNTHGNTRHDSASQKWISDPKVIPPEIEVTFVYESKGYLYSKKDGVTKSIAGMVYRHHNPTEQVAFRRPVYHMDGDKHNNQISNLSLMRGD